MYHTVIADPIFVALNTLAGIAFALIHGTMRYRWSGILAFLVICLVVSNIMENTSILTGFPFGHYYYSSALGPKLFSVPLFIGPGYFSTGYLAWVLLTILVGDMHRYSSAFKTFVVPFIATFIMVIWDVVLDPTSSTIRHEWVWEQGGGYFGVLLMNYLGWFFTAFVFMLLFALFLHFRKTDHRETWTLPRSYLENGDTPPEEVTVVLRDPQLDGDALIYKVEVLDGALSARAGPCSLFIDPIGRPLSPVSVMGVHRRERRRMR